MENVCRNNIGMDFLRNPMGVTRWALLVLTVITFTTPASSTEPRVVCYYTNWSVYRPGTAKFNPQNINPYLCTHLIYAFGGFTKDNTLKPFDKYQDIEKGGYAKFTGLKTYNQKLKTLLAIGGWNEGSSRFSPMVAARDKRKEFVRNAIKFLRQNRFDGLDLDWEYPAFRDGGKPKDRENYSKLVKELREEFERESEKTGKPRLLLTMAVPAGIEYIQKGFDVKTLNQYLDWMNLLTYDYHSAFEPAVNHHAPLYPLEEPNEYSVDNELNIDYTIKYYLENGADADKLVLGIPTYGRSYTLFNPDASEIGAPADGPGEQGDATREKGYLAYYEICESLKPKDKKRSKRASDDSDDEESSEDSSEIEDLPWTVVQPNPAAMGPYAYKGNQWVGYDDVDIVKKKAEYVAENGLGGIMFWSIDNDDFRGSCHGKPYPLIEAAKEAYISRLGFTDNTIISTSRPSRPSSNRRNRPRTSTTQRTTTKSSSRKSVQSTTPSWSNTPEPPTTPDPGSDFKCTDEGFFPHPRDCKKYFWCLDSGPSNLGIVAHQFTCPSGLFFNKAADSCDFARNVLCKKPAATTKAPVTRAESTTVSTTSTTRRAVKLTTKNAALFRTTTTTTTTPEPEVEEEYEEEEEAGDVEAEDPRVIKELIDLIKKVGGVEQLEKQLGLSSSSSVTSSPTTFNKKLYQKVLEKTRARTSFGTNKKLDSTNTISVQNSRGGPQNAGLDQTDDKDKKLRKDRPQYTSINRIRSSTSAPSDDSTPSRTFSRNRPVVEEDSGTSSLSRPTAEEDSRPFSRSRQVEDGEEQRGSTVKPLQYVNIRRARPTSDTADDTASRNALFERSEPFLAVSEPPDSLDIVSARRENKPEYVTIRRQRPTLEETTTTGYKTIEEDADEAQDSQETALEREISSPVSPQYKSIVRQRSTTPTTTPEETITPSPTTVLSIQISSLLNTPEEETELEPETEQTTTTTVATTTTAATTTTPSSTTTSTTQSRRVVARRRGTTTPATTTTAASVSQVSSRNYTFISRRRPTRPNDIPSSDASDEGSRKIRSTTPDSREVNSEVKVNAGEVRSFRRFKSRTRQSEQPSQSDDSVPAAASPVSRGQFRPQLNKDDLISLTPIDVDEVPLQLIPRPTVTQRGTRRFRGRTSTTVSNQDDSEFSAATVEVGSPNIIPRGRSRYSFNSENENSDITPTPSPKRLTFARFTPRPFTKPSSSDEADSIIDQTVTERIRTRLPNFQARKVPYSFGRSTTLQSIVNENSDDLYGDERPDDIALSESSIEENEENIEEHIETTAAPKRKIIIKKLRASTSTTESAIPDSSVGSTESSFIEGPDGKKRFRVIRRRPSSTSAPITTTEDATLTVPRVRKIIRKKIKPIEQELDIISKPKDTVEESKKTKISETITTSEPLTTEISEIKAEENTEAINIDIKQEQIIKSIQNENTEISSSEELAQNNFSAATQTEPSIDGDSEKAKDSVSIAANEVTEPIVMTEKETQSPETTSTSTTQITIASTRGRIPYRPGKRLFTPTTESPPPISSRTFSRKYNPGVYTSPATVERTQESFISTTRRSLFSSRTFTRKPFTTARTTQKVEEEEEYVDEENIKEQPEDALVLVPPSKLFTRRPSSEDGEENPEHDGSQERENDQDLEVADEEDIPPRRFIPGSRRPNFGPRVVNSNTFRTSTSTTELPKQNRTLIYNRFSGNKSIDNKKRIQNIPIGYNTSVDFEETTKESETDYTSTTLKINENGETTTMFEDDDYLSMPDTTTISSSNQTELDIPTTNTIQSESSTYKIEIDNGTDDYLEFTGETTEFTKQEDMSTNYQTETQTDDFTKELRSTTNLEPTITTEVITDTTTIAPAHVPSTVKTQFDKLFSVSRRIEVYSKLDKHRINKNNETTLIEEGTIMVEKKPQVDKIGEVSRYSLIKIVEDEIPIYLTKLGHVYPVEHPPDNLIRIDEGRNAKSLLNFVEAPREHLVASESMNEGYRHVNNVNDVKEEDVGKGEIEHITGDDFLSYINDEKKEPTSSEQFVPQWQFVPAAYENEQNKEIKAAKSFEVITPRNILTSPSTLSLEGLFKTEKPLVAPKVENNNGQPFLVYSASVPNQKEEANIVKLDVIKEVGRSIVTFAKGQEFKGAPVSDVSTTESHINVVILPKSTEDMSNTASTMLSSTTTTSTTTTESIVKMMNPVIEMLMATPIPVTTLSTESADPSTVVTTEATEITEVVTETVATTKISPLDAKRSKFAFPRRPILKPSNFTRPSPVPRVSKKINSSSVNNLNQKANKTSSFNPSKSRFSGNRAQNVPIDIRRKSSTPKSFTTETPRSTTERKLYFKPIRPNFRPGFIPRKSTTPATQAAKDRRTNFLRRTKATAAPYSSTAPAEPDVVETTTARFTRRGNSRFKSRNDIDKPAKNDTLRQPSSAGGVVARNERPRNFVRRRLGGANGSTTTTTSTTTSPSTSGASSTRRPFRVVTGRRRLASSTRGTTTLRPATTIETVTEPATTLQQAYEESLQDIIDDDSRTPIPSSEIASIEDESSRTSKPKKTVKIQRRPLFSLKEDDQNPSATNEEERKRQSKKYSASFKQNQLDEVLKQKKIQEQTTVIGTTIDDYDAETALAIAAHQLITAPLPSVSNFDENPPPKKTTPSRTTVEYSFTSPTYSAKSTTGKPVFIEEFSTPNYKSSSLTSTFINDPISTYTAQAPSGFTKNLPTGFISEFTTAPSFGMTPPTISPGVSNLGPSTARYFSGSRRFTGSPINDFSYTNNQEPAYFTREYLLESPVTKTYDSEYQYLSPTAPEPTTKTLPRKTVYRKISTTIKPTTRFISLPPATTPKPRRVPSKKPFEKISKWEENKNYNNAGEYLPDTFDYYDDQNEKLVQKNGDETKVIVHGKGSIECLDIGNFPHPTSCRKFISCARLESGAVIGWQYVCPRGLSFDPVGGMCNWAAGLGCEETAT